MKNSHPTPEDYTETQLNKLLQDIAELEFDAEEMKEKTVGGMTGRSHDQATLLRAQVEILANDIRRLRMALRTVLPHAPVDARRYAEKVLEETR